MMARSTIDAPTREEMKTAITEALDGIKREPASIAVLAALKAISMILSARALVVMGLIGSFIICLIVLKDPSILKLVCLFLYCAGINAPVVVLCWRKGFPSGG